MDIHVVIGFICNYFQGFLNLATTPRDGGGILWILWTHFLFTVIPILGIIFIAYFVIKWAWKEVL